MLHYRRLRGRPVSAEIFPRGGPTPQPETENLVKNIRFYYAPAFDLDYETCELNFVCFTLVRIMFTIARDIIFHIKDFHTSRARINHRPNKPLSCEYKIGTGGDARKVFNRLVIISLEIATTQLKHWVAESTSSSFYSRTIGGGRLTWQAHKKQIPRRLFRSSSPVLNPKAQRRDDKNIGSQVCSWRLSSYPRLSCFLVLFLIN